MTNNDSMARTLLDPYASPHAAPYLRNKAPALSIKVGVIFVITCTLVGPFIASAPYMLIEPSMIWIVYLFGLLPALIGALLFFRWWMSNAEQSCGSFVAIGGASGMMSTLLPGLFIAFVALAMGGDFGSAMLVVAFALYMGMHGAVSGALLASAAHLAMRDRTGEPS